MSTLSVNAELLEWLALAWSDPIAACERWPERFRKGLPHWRVVHALADEQMRSQTVGPADIASLIRAVLRHHTATDPYFYLAVPQKLWERAATALKASSVASFQANDGYVRLRAHEWRPAWLDPAHGISPDDGLYEYQLRREDPTAAGDPMLRRMGFTDYQSLAQREAVRTVLSVPPGSTVVVNLPTGSGKSLCGFLPSLLNGMDEGLSPGVTPIVVPTVALAMDLERHLKVAVQHPMAYVVDRREQCDEIRRRSATGNQGPVLLSPESLGGQMRRPLLTAASEGNLRYLVIDEAHMVTAWGDEFRPAFQQIPGVRRDLMQAIANSANGKPLVTILMSATLSEYNLRSLEEMFSPGECSGGEFRIVHAARLRPEPAWWSARANTEIDRRSWLLEAVRHLPKPLILYTLKRMDALAWFNRLQEAGFSRVGMIRGDTSDTDRLLRLQQWNDDHLDIMVATSAFGLGVDKPDVRAVLHAALPEGLDRLYQDVGRGGRDGYPSLSLVVWTDDDWRPAAAMASPTFIGIDRGLQRWKAMFFDDHRMVLGDDRYTLRVTQPPGTNSGDIDMDNEENEKWNRRTLTLMARAGLIEVGGDRDEQDGEGTKADSRDTMTIRVLRSGLDRIETWQAHVEGRRQELSRNYKKNVHGMKEILKAGRCVSYVLQDCYRSERYEVPVVRACGGCAYCRNNNRPPIAGRLLARQTPQHCPPSGPVGTDLSRLFGEARLSLFYYPTSDDVSTVWERMTFLARWLISQGVINLTAEPSLLEHWRSGTSLLVPGRSVFLHERLPQDVTKAQPTAVFVPFLLGSIWRAVWRTVGPSEGQVLRRQESVAPMVIVLPASAHDPERPDRLAHQILRGATITLEAWEQEFAL
jgi:ATP-dependent DNA helicase RecQ